MNKKNKILSILLSTMLVGTMLTGSMTVTANDDVTVKLNGAVIDFDVPAQIVNGRTMVPLRKIFEEIGASVKWDGDTKTVSARKSSKTVTMVIDSADMQISKGDTDEDGSLIYETVTLEVPSQILDGRTLVPARAVSEAFGLSVDWDEETKTVVIADDDVDDDTWKENTGTINLSDLTCTDDGVEITDNQIKITKGGDFTVTGTLDDGNITVNTEEKVKIRLSGASVTSSTNPCIYVENADKAYITVTDGTENSLTALSDSDAVYSKDNLEIKGDGILNIKSSGGHAIKASDNLTVENGVLNLTAEGDGIHVNDTFKMTGGEVNILAVGDGIDSESIVIIEDGELDITTNGTPVEATAAQTETMQNNFSRTFENKADVEFEKSSKGINAEWMMTISGGDININSASHAIHCGDEIDITGGKIYINSNYDKGISAHGNLTIDGADTVIDIIKSTEGLESKNVLTINNGTIDVVSSDDGINATGGKSGEMMGGGGNRTQNQKPQDEAAFDNAALNNQETFAKPQRNQSENGDDIAMQREKRGERTDMQMNGERPPLTENGEMPAPDFAVGENRPQGGSGMMGGNQKECLIINGGIITVIAGDDCLDSNGNLTINGGIVKATKVNGTFIGNESVIDPDGRAEISKDATVIAAVSGYGSQGNVSIPQNMISLYSETNRSVGDKISLTDENENALIEYIPNGEFNAVIIISSDIKTDENYTLTVGGESYDITVSEQNTVIGTPSNQNGFGGGRLR